MKDRDAAMRSGIAAIWEKFLPQVQEQIASLVSVAESVQHGTLTQDQRRAGERNAHRLAGSLGTFGFDEGTRAARELELMLAGSDAIDAAKLSDCVRVLRRSIDS